MTRTLLLPLLTLLCLSALSPGAAPPPLFSKPNLAAWCIVPFDAAKRGPEARAAMLQKLGFTKFVYDYRAEHIPQWDEELTALKKHNVELYGWWFPTTLNAEAKKTLDLFKRHNVHPQLWVNGNGGPIDVTSPDDQKARIEKEVARIRPICEAAAPLGCQVALYNHGNWYGEPENAIAIVEALKAQDLTNIGIVYNLHHGHGHLERLEKVLPKMLPHLLCLNLNGMDIAGDAKGRKILPIGVGTEDARVLKIITNSGYKGVIGILNHTNEDAEGRLQDNLDGLAWLLGPGSAKPAYRTWKETAAKPTAPKPAQPISTSPKAVPSLNADFGTALQGALNVPGKEAWRTLPITIELRAKLNSAKNFNILLAHETKASATHWEVYTYRDSGVFSVYLPGRGGEFKSSVNICDGEWHDLIANLETDKVTLWIDGKQVLQKPAQPLKGLPIDGDLAFGQLVEGGHGCDGLIDDVRLSRGFMKPRKVDSPRQTMDITLAIWNFDDLDKILAARPHAPEPAAFTPDRKPLREAEYAHWQADINRERVFDYYGKQAVQFMGKPLPDLIPGFPGLDGGQQGHWGNQNDATTWRDGRFAASDLGNVFSTVFKGAGLTITKAVCVRFDDKAACFDPQSLSFPVTWSGGFIRLSDARHGFMGGGSMNGKALKKSEPKPAPEGSTYHGFYRHGKDVIFSYTIDSTQYLATARDGRQPAGKLAHLTKGGPAQWPQ
ncbi:MAG TPA: DUF6797 domain-containing protein, partial [Prosthecobacter sp.]|nr:DUF6797 domain-containing protein [Prosthecobacter sp.]